MEMKNQATVGKWSNLPAELVMAIEENVTLYVDKVRFRSVCLSWNSIVPKVPNQQERRLPWLLQSLDGGKNPSHKGLFNLIDRRVYELHVPDSQGKIFKGSSHGWLISVEEGINMYLINPLNGTQIKLPPRTKFPDVKNYRANKLGNEYGLMDPKGKGLLFNESVHVNLHYMDKVVLSSPPSSEREEDCTVVAIYGSYARLAYCKCNDAKWTLLRGNYRESFMDLIFHKGKLHALNSKGEILIFESVSPKSKVTKIVSPQPWTSDLYLVESSDGGLLMVERHINTIEGDEGISCNTFGFTVYKHDPSNSSWFVVTSIGEDMLFLGFNSSFSISSSSCPFTEFKGNRIYFTDNMTDFHNENNNERGGDVGLFNLEDESIESLPGFKRDRNLYWPPPVWVTPSPYLLY